MTDADNLTMLGRVVGGLIVVLVLIGLAARVARRARGHKGTSGLRVVDRVGLSREANLAVVEVGNRLLLLGVTAQGVTMLADLDHENASATVPSAVDPELDGDQDLALRAIQAAREQTRARPGRGLARPGDPARPSSRPGDPAQADDTGAQRTLLPTGVTLDEYPDLASALRAAGRTAEISHADEASTASPDHSTAAATPGSEVSAVEVASVSTPRTRAEARAEARARALAAAQADEVQAAAELVSPAESIAASFSQVDRIPLPRAQAEAEEEAPVVKSKPVPSAPASGSVLSPSTWRQGLEALRDLTVRRG